MTTRTLTTPQAPPTPRPAAQAPAPSSGGRRHDDVEVEPLAAARLLATIAAAHASDNEQERTLTRPVVDAIVASRLAGLIAPTELGGQAADPGILVDVLATVAAADASTGWCLAIGMGTNHFSGYVAESAARRLFTDLDRPACGVFAPSGRARRTDGGYELSGRWAFTSGCEHAAVQACGMMVVGDNGVPEFGPDGFPVMRLAFVPTTSIDIIDTWNTAGLRATGSHDTTATAVRVDEDATMAFGDAAWSSDAIFRLPIFCVLAPCLASVALGIGRSALDVVAARVQAEFAAPAMPGPKTRFCDDPVAQLQFGRAEVRLRAARALLLEALATCMAAVRDGDPVPRAAAALVGLACREAMAAAANAVDVAGELAGSSSVRVGSVIERLRRDIDTLRKHQLFSSTHQHPLGRQVAGIPTVAFPFLIEPLGQDVDGQAV